MKKFLFVALFICLSVAGKAQSLYFPPLTGSTWDTVSLDTLGWCRDKVDTLLNYLGNRNTKAFVVLKDGKIAIEKYYGTFTVDSLWYWASAGKTITAFTVGIAQQEGLLSINDTSSQYLGTGWTDCTPAQEQRITIRHQLTMTTGLNDGVADHYCTLDTCLQYLADAGTRWAYHNGPYTLLDDVLSTATGTTLNAYINTRLKAPTGMTGAFVPSGFNNLYISTARSMARFGLLIHNRGTWNTTPVMTDTNYFNQMVNTSQALNLSYGYLWWLNGKASYMVPSLTTVFTGPLCPSAPPDMIAALGKNGQLLNISRSKGIVFVRMGDVPTAGEVPFTLNDTVWQKLNDVMCNTTAISSPDVVVLPEPQLYPNPATGYCTLALPGSFHFLVTDVTGRLIHSATAENKVAMTTTTWQPGVYMVQVVTAGRQPWHLRLVVQ